MRSESRLSSVVCFKHFKPDDLARRLEVQEENAPWLKRDEFGITAFPRICAAVVASEKQQSVSEAEGGTEEWLHISLSKCSLP